MENENLNHEKIRILIAYDLKIPPDNIDLNSIFQSAFRAIRESCENKNEEIILTLKNINEEKAILGEYGQEIINRIFLNQYPFEGIVDRYHEWYVSNFLNKIDMEGEI